MRITLDHIDFSYVQKKKKAFLSNSKRMHNMELESALTLRNICLTIEQGDYIAIAGPSGSGKSTLLHMIKGLLAPTAGSLIFDNRRVSAKRRQDLQQFNQIGYVFQYPEHQLFATSVFLDVSFGLRQKTPKLTDQEIEDRTRQALEHVGLDYQRMKDKNPFELSGGEKRKVAIAGTLVQTPKVLLLDEPTAGLDSHGRDDLFRFLHDLNTKENVTIIFVSHQLEDIVLHAARMVVLHKGKIAKDGSPSEIIQDTDFLASVDLDGIDSVFLAKKMRAFGWNPPSDPWNVESMIDTIDSYKKQETKQETN